MKTTIKNRGAESTLTISGDFYQILDENFASVCMAIANKGVILKELIHLFDKDDKAIDTVIQIIMKSHFPQEATDNLQEKVGITELTAKYAQYYLDYSIQESASWKAGTYDESHFKDDQGNLKYPIPFGSNGNVAPAGQTYYEMVKTKLGFNLESWQVAMIQERRKEFNAEWTLSPALRRAGLLAEHIAHNYPKDNTEVKDLDKYLWTPRKYDYNEDKMDFPIPATEILRNPNLTQNKAYR